jgi:hypothetical protein
MLYSVQHTASVDVCKSFIHFAGVAVYDSRLYQQYSVMIRLFVSTVRRNDRLYISTTTSWYGCIYRKYYVMIGCLYQQYYFMTGCLFQQYYFMIRLFISTVLRHDTAVYISITLWYGCLYQHYVMIQLFISKALRHDTAVCINSITSWYGCIYQQYYVMIRLFISQHYVMIRLFILGNVNTKI